MDSKEFDAKYRQRFDKLGTTHIADALDKVGFRGAVWGIRPMFDCPKILGRAVTMRQTAAGMIRPPHHGGMRAAEAATPGDVMVVDNRGDLNNNSWGEIVATASQLRGACGVVADGAVRDVDECRAIGFPVFARGAVPITARGRLIEESFQEPVRIGDVQVRPGDIVMADGSGVVVIPVEKLDEVLEAAEMIFDKEQAILAELRKGTPPTEVDRKSGYEKMVDKG